MPHPERLRYHLDESCSPNLAPGLRLRGVDVTTSQDTGLLGRPDEDQLAHAHADGRILVTHDDDFMKLNASGRSHSGIVYCRQRRYPLGEMVRRLVLIWEILDPEEMKDRVEYL
jgi:predicted nuclease of predicted toxin-antitoxin system